MLIQYLIQAYKGKIVWERIKKKYGRGIAPSRYIVFPEDDEEYNKWALYYMPKYLEREHFDKVIILTSSPKLEEECKKIKHANKKILMVDERKMRYLIRFAGLVNMNDEWTIISVKQPYDTCAEQLLGKKGITKRDIVWYDIYKMATDRKYKQ